MDLLRHLIGYFIKIAFAFFFAALIWWLVSLLFPSLSLRSLMISVKMRNSSTTTEGWLPSPRKYSGLLGKRAAQPDENTNLYVSGEPYTSDTQFNGYNLSNDQYQYTKYNYVTYTSSGMRTVNGSTGEEVTQGMPEAGTHATSSVLPVQPASALTSNRSLTVRNLSIYEGGHVYTGLSFIGEARNSMFRDGKFPILMIDQAGRVIGVSAARATTDWTVPGWTRFETKIIYALPVNTPCTMIFEEALTEVERRVRQPLRVPIQMRCN